MGKTVSPALGAFDITALLRQIVFDLGTYRSSLQTWRRVGAGKQQSGASVNVSQLGGLEAKQQMGQTVVDARGFGPVGGKQTFGRWIDVIRALSELSARFDKLAERSGVSSPELGFAASAQSLMESARAAGLARETVATIIQEELNRAFSDGQSKP